MKRGKYVPNTEADWEKWYPGRKISVERRKQLDELRYDARGLEADDVIYMLGKAYSGLFHDMVRAMKTVIGDDAIKQILKEFGHIRGVRNMGKVMKVVGTNDPTPEHWSWFQDAAHASGGLEASQAYSEYDSEKCVVKRKHCQFYTQGQNPDTREYCRYFHIGAHSAYNEKQPTVEAKLVKCMLDGDDHCEDVFKRKKH